MEILEERFRSRFEWGLIADITLPDYETRMAILHKKEELDGYNISEEVIKYIATNIKSNIRELEGAFNKVMASSKLEKRKSLWNLLKSAERYHFTGPAEGDHAGIHYFCSGRALSCDNSRPLRKQKKLKNRYAETDCHVFMQGYH